MWFTARVPSVSDPHHINEVSSQLYNYICLQCQEVGLLTNDDIVFSVSIRSQLLWLLYFFAIHFTIAIEGVQHAKTILPSLDVAPRFHYI